MIGVELVASCKLDKPCRDCFPEYFAEIALVAIPESYARHFEGDPYHPLGLGIEFRALQKLRDWHDRFRYRAIELIRRACQSGDGQSRPYRRSPPRFEWAIGFGYLKSEQRGLIIMQFYSNRRSAPK
jgi:hypothetical protein